jgi:hypothetical protein
MSQYGSYNLANIGWSGEQILNFYYPGTQIQPLSSSLVFWQPPEGSSQLQLSPQK